MVSKIGKPAEPLVVHSPVQHNQVYPAVSSGLYAAIVAAHVPRDQFKTVNIVLNSQPICLESPANQPEWSRDVHVYPRSL